MKTRRRQKPDYVKRYALIRPFVKFKFKRPAQLGRVNKAKITRYWKKIRALKGNYQLITPKRGKKYPIKSELNRKWRGKLPELKAILRKKPFYSPPAEKYEVIRSIADYENEPFEAAAEAEMPPAPPEIDLIPPIVKQYAEGEDIEFDPAALEKDPEAYIKDLINRVIVPKYGKDAKIKVICGGDMTGKPILDVDSMTIIGYDATTRKTGTAFIQGNFYPHSPDALVSTIERQIDRYDWKAFLFGLRVVKLINQE